MAGKIIGEFGVFMLLWFAGSMAALVYANYRQFLPAEHIIVTAVGIGLILASFRIWWRN